MPKALCSICFLWKSIIHAIMSPMFTNHLMWILSTMNLANFTKDSKHYSNVHLWAVSEFHAARFQLFSRSRRWQLKIDYILLPWKILWTRWSSFYSECLFAPLVHCATTVLMGCLRIRAETVDKLKAGFHCLHLFQQIGTTRLFSRWFGGQLRRWRGRKGEVKVFRGNSLLTWGHIGSRRGFMTYV